MSLLTAEDVHYKKFTPTKFREGYDPDEVDDFLDQVVATLATLEEENSSLKAQLAQAEERVAYASAPAPEEPVAHNVVEDKTVEPEPVEEPVAQEVNEPENATALITLAQRIHDEYVQNGREEGERVISEARAQGEQIVREAEEESRRVHDKLESERTSLESRIDELKQFERDYRGQLHTHLETLLKEVDEGGAQI